MSIRKQSLIIQQPEGIKKNSKLQHLHHLISRVYDIFQQDCSTQCKDVSKYDLIARNIDECLLLLSFRERQQERMNKYAGKIKKAIKKI